MFWSFSAGLVKMTGRCAAAHPGAAPQTNERRNVISKQTLKTLCVWLSALLVLLLFLPSEARAGNVSISVGYNGMNFSPNPITIAPGDSIDWVGIPGRPPRHLPRALARRLIGGTNALHFIARAIFWRPEA
jgi:hypothetical protein